MTKHFADCLLAACRDKGAPVCVGIDPVLERLPDSLKPDDARSAHECVNAISRFCHDVLDAVADHVPCVKFQSACFERYLWPGVEALYLLMARARELGLLVLLDAKRGDIGISAAHYAAAALGEHRYNDLPHLRPCDALTVNAYLGMDSLEPFVKQAAEVGSGLFALVRTSNPGSDALQNQPLASGKTVAQTLGQSIAALGDQPGCVGESGYSLLGAVVGATKPDDAASLRKIMPRQIFLVPGFGAQGGGAKDVVACFNADGQGALVTASRSVLYPFDPGDADWQDRITAAAKDLRQQIRQVIA